MVLRPGRGEREPVAGRRGSGGGQNRYRPTRCYGKSGTEIAYGAGGGRNGQGPERRRTECKALMYVPTRRMVHVPTHKRVAFPTRRVMRISLRVGGCE
eukprot:2585598-Rhodomonas_salina.1